MSQLGPDSEFGSYHIVRHIGGGGMAQIYLAKTKGLAGFEKYLALKVINPEFADEDRFIQMLIDEAKIAVGLSHINIAQVFDLAECNGIYYIAMEFVDGLDILELVNGLHGLGERLPVEAVAYVGRQICSGLHYAHTKTDAQGNPINIVHRDISPQNILVSRAGEVKLVDFGIAKAAGVSSKTQAGVIKGKVNYMAPEQVSGKKAAPRTDIFSVGVVLWEMLTSQMLYSGDNVGELVAKVRKADISPPSSVRPEVPAQLDAVVMKALHANPIERFQTAHALQVELTRFLSANAPGYSGTQLSQLLERVLERKQRPDINVRNATISKDDKIQDKNSLIYVPEARLVMETDQGEQSYPIEGEVTIGRAGHVAVSDARASRKHAAVKLVGETYMVRDLGSSNGTYLNDQRLAEQRPLQHGDVIRVGQCRIHFYLDQKIDADAVETAKRPPPALVMSHGTAEMAQEIGEGISLTYQVALGALTIRGTAANVRARSDGYWIEPLGERTPVRVNGVVINEMIRLGPKDTIEISGINYALRV